MANSPYKKQKKKTWDAFSKYIRTRDCIEYLKSHPEINELKCPCVTCNRVYEFKKLQADLFPLFQNLLLRLLLCQLEDTMAHQYLCIDLFL